MKRMLKRLGMMIIGFVGIFFTIFFSNDMMHFLSANTKAGSIYNIGDTVIFGKESFTYIGDDGSNLLLLGESSIGDNKTWNDANTIANNYRNSFGNIGKTVSVSSLASTNDLLQVGTTGTDSSGNTVITALDASIPQLPGNWWLKDDDLSSKKLARFLSAQNKREGYQSYQKYTPAIGGVCQAPTNAQTEVGTGFINSFSDGGGDASSFLSSAKYRFKIQYIRGNTRTIKRYPRSTCVESEAEKFDYLVGDVRENNIRFSQSSNNGPMNLEGKPLMSVLFVPGNIFDGGVAAPNFTVTGLSVGWSKTVTFKQGVCYQLSSSTSSMNIASIGDDGIYRYGFQVGGKPGGSATVKFTLVDIIDPIYSTTTCPAVTTPAMTMSTRPLMKLPLDKILTYHNAKPTYALSTKLTGKQPVSDTSGSRPYLTMMSNAMNVNLDASDPGVKGTILSLKYPTSSTLIDLPLTFSGAKEGTRYLAASATDINGKEVYDVLDVISADKQSVSIDYQNLLKDGENSFQLTLYVIDDGVGDTSYRSNGTTITVRLKDDQAIDFDKLYNKATVEYGSELELHANLTSDVNKQSSSDLVFSIPSDSRGKYQIIKQSYDKTTGEAKVTIRPLTAGTNAKISISKSGDLFYFDAEERTMNLNFTKKELIVHPSVIEGKTIGDAMPNILSESSELAFSDTIPDALSPYLERTSPLIAEDPDVAGIIQNPGTWKLLYHADVLNDLGDFTDKYNVILEDYRDDTKYVFAVDPNGIPDGWIEISPQPNNNGWNNTDVKVKPSNEAIYFGYHSITDGNQDPINELTYTNEDKGFLPRVSLVSDEGPSSPKTLRKVRIDKTSPNVNVQVPSGWYAGSMNIVLNLTDTLSGLDTFTLTKGGDALTCGIVAVDTYECPITSNGIYTITATDMAGNTTTVNQTITNIDDTRPTISAVSGSLHADKLKQDIDVTRTVGISGVDSLRVLYKGDGESNFTFLENLNPYKAMFTYEAQMNGEYRFELTTGSKEVVYADVSVTQIEQNAPVVKIETALANQPTRSYVDSTWTNDDVIVTLSNANKNFKEPITFQYKKVSDTDWSDVTENAGTQLTIATSTWMKEEYMFRAYVSDQVISFPMSYGFWIDKEQPQTPEIDHASEYTDANAFYEAVKVEGNLIPKNSGINQTMYVQINGGVWTSLGADTFIDITTMGRYELQFKSIDEAGNESEPTDIYIVNYNGNKKRQEIAFDMGPATLTYGKTITIEAYLDQDVNEQAETDIIFSVGDTNKAKIISQGYDKTTGRASALVKAMNGDRYVDILINKAGDMEYLDAVQATYTLMLDKVAIEIKPQIINGTMVKDAMPTIGSECDGLIESDQIPTSVKPTLTAMNGSAIHPDADNDGIIENAGTWSMTYANDVLNNEKAFADKYDVTFIGYDATDHTEYVFEVGTNGIPDSYLIITPNPNAQGWNNTDVKIELSNDALAAGYTSIALIESNMEVKQGSEILLDQETSGTYPVIVLKNATETSDRKTLREVKIDKTNPNATIQIENETIWTSKDKKVSIVPIDALSQVKQITVIEPSGATLPLTQNGAAYEFNASDNGNYQITIEDNAENQKHLTIPVEKIDKVKPTITATSKGLNSDGTIHEIDVRANAGASQAKAFEVYYKKQASDAYTLLATLNPATLTQIYEAQKNGYYKFVIENNAQEKAEAEIEITDIIETKETPILQIEAKTDDGKAYASGTWVNQDVSIKLKNTNVKVVEPITYEHRIKGSSTWNTMDSDHMKIEEDHWQNNDYEFRGITKDGEGNPTSISVCIDKEQPDEPTIQGGEQFIAGNQHASPLTIGATITPKASGINQEIQYSLDHGITWQVMGNNTLTLTTPQTYEILFKSVDEAGNESNETKLYEIELNDGIPEITIKLNNDPIKKLINALTFGFFYQQTVSVDIEVEWYGNSGDIYYILDDDPNAKIPSDSDSRWTPGDHTSIDPDRKTMIYAKAVNKDGKTIITSSLYNVIADATPPTIAFDKTYGTWTKDDTLQATMNDNLSGIKEDAIQVKIDHKDKITTSMKNDVLTMSNLPEGQYQLQVQVEDNSGNETKENIEVKIDKTAPEVIGVKDKSVYHHYYLPRFIEVKDELSGVNSATIEKDGTTVSITKEIKINEIGTYVIETTDNAGNEGKVTFVLVPLPDIETEIDGSDESKEIIDQIKQEYEETKDRLDETEKDDILQWIEDATNKWNGLRVKVVYNEDKTAKIEAIGDETFPPKMVLVVEEIDKKTLPTLPREALEAYDVYLKLGDKIIQPTQTVKVYLPYENTQNETYLYEVNEKNKVKEIDNKQENGYLIFETKTLEKYAISDETQKTNVNIDTDNDGKPDINIDVDCDGQADINIDTDGDNKPDINIDTTGDGKPNYNIDIDQDNEPDINIGPIEWKPNKCQTNSCGKEYCTSTYYKPYLNIDTDDDGRADVNLDLNKDKIADLNIDIDQDYIPDIEIDINGDAKADINIDTNGDGRPEKNLAIIQEWKPDLNVDSPMKYDTMSNIKVDESLTPDTWKPSKNAHENNHPLNNKVNNSAQGGAITGEMNKAFYLWMMFIVSACILFIIHSYKKRKCL